MIIPVSKDCGFFKKTELFNFSRLSRLEEEEPVVSEFMTQVFKAKLYEWKQKWKKRGK